MLRLPRLQRLQFARPVTVRRMLFHTKPGSRLLQEATIKQTASSSSGGAKQEAPKKGIKYLMTKYGYSALGVYLAISFVDLPLSFLLVHSMGQERITEMQNSVKRFLGFSTEPEEVVVLETETPLASESDKEVEVGGWKSYFNPTLLTEFGLAYALHKSLIFIRVPLTAAITPKLVKQLQQWGFNIGKRAVKTVTAAPK